MKMSTKKSSVVLSPIMMAAMVFSPLPLNEVQAKTSKLVKKSWGLVGSFGLDVTNAWNSYKGSCSNVTIAVIDTGVDFSHPDLINSKWTNLKEAGGKPGVDDDNNGYVDDFYGWDYVTKSGKQIVDVHGHGTHIAGLIAARSKTSEGFSGVCPGAKIMSLRYHGPEVSGTQALDFTVKAINYAIDNGADIINYSGGGRYYSSDEHRAMKRALEKGVIVVAAAGNEMSNVDDEANKYYPASYGLTNIISVAGINASGVKVSSSNWGKKSVDLAAPGKDILSTGLNGSYQLLTGTSQATALVSGVVAMVKGQNKFLDFGAVKKILMNSSKPLKQLEGKTKLASRVNAYEVVKALGAKKPSAPKVAKKQKVRARSTATWQHLSSQKEQGYIHPALNR